MKRDLTLDHIKEVMTQDILIGSDSISKKRFVYNPQLNEFRIFVDNRLVTSGQDIEALLNEYNSI